MRLIFLISILSVGARAGDLNGTALKAKLELLTTGFDARVGVCALGAKESACLRGTETFSLQSVMKLIVGVAVLDAVDHQGWTLADPVIVRKEDLSLSMQPIAEFVGETGYHTTVGELVRRAIVDSDSAAVDFLVAKLGGIGKVQAFLNRKKITGMRIDRDEKHLQTEISGIGWKPAYVDAKLLDQVTVAIPEAKRSAAYEKYQRDQRDTSSPTGMVQMLRELAAGRLVSKSSTQYLLGIMDQTATGPDRLKAGLLKGWRLGHKTGTSGSWKGLTVAFNDVGVMYAPDGGTVVIAVFVGDSHAEATAKAALMANISKAVCQHYLAN